MSEHGSLDGVVVLDELDGAASYCGRLLAGLGADVVKLEPPGGAPSRRWEPIDERTGDSLFFAHYNIGKRSVVVEDAAQVAALCDGADVLLTDRAIDGHPGLVVCALTPFGLTGPWKDYVADDLVLMALGGSMAACGYGTDDPPLACFGEQAWHTAATYAAIAVLAALAWRAGDGNGRGQLLDVSAHQCAASVTEWHVMNYLCTGTPTPRFRHPTVTARDGKEIAALIPDFLGPHVFANLLRVLEADGVAGPLSNPAFVDPAHRAASYGEIHRAVRRLAQQHDGEELFRLGQEAGLPWGVIRAPEEVLGDRHLRARGHFVEIDGLTHCGAPFLAERTPFRFSRNVPPLNDE